MKKKVVLVTGGSGGIGREIVEQQAREGNIVCLQYGNNVLIADEIQAQYDNVYLFQQDFLDPNITLIRDVVLKFGRIDCLINCAGVMADESIFTMTHSGFDKLFSINTKVPYILASQAFIEMEKNKYGRIINISSFVVKYGMGRNCSIQYAGSKAALESLTIGLSRLGAENNILVNTIRPGVIETDMQKDRSELKARIQMIPVKRMGYPREVAQMVSYLLSDAGDFITGQTITISGGE